MLSLESDDASQYAHSVKHARYRGLDAGGHVDASVVVSSIFALFGLSCGMAARRSKHFQRRVLSRPSSAGRDSRLAVFSSLGIVARTMLGLAREGILSACATAGGNQNFDHGPHPQLAEKPRGDRRNNRLDGGFLQPLLGLSSMQSVIRHIARCAGRPSIQAEPGKRALAN